jgi:hypothetical protein
MFGRAASGLSRVYEYGCVPRDCLGLDEAIEQMARRNRFWNRLVEIDATVRESIAGVNFAHAIPDPVSKIREQLGHVRRQIRQGRRAPREGTEQQSLIEEVRQLKQSLSVAIAEVKRMKQAAMDAMRPDLEEIERARRELVNQAQIESELYWGNYDEVRRSYEIARRQAQKKGKTLLPRAWNGSGKTTVRFQSGLPAPRAFGKNTRLQIEPIPDEAWTSPVRSARRKLSRTRLRIRVGSKADRSPIWFELAVILHRPLPSDGSIRAASVIRERVGFSWRYRALLVVVIKVPEPPSLLTNRPAIALDVGWRLVPEGLRVAYWCGDDGTHDSVVMPSEDVQQFRKVDELRSLVALEFNEAKTALADWLARCMLPEDFSHLTGSIAPVHSPSQLKWLVDSWHAFRVDDDRGILATLVAWRKRYIHLWTWEVNLLDQLVRRRRELYRRFASLLANRCRVVILKDFDLRRVSRRPMPESTALWIPSRNRFVASPSVLRRTIQVACETRGVPFVYVDGKNATRACHGCGSLDDWSPADALTHCCSSCGLSWDQDYNAALQLLRRALLVSSDGV